MENKVKLRVCPFCGGKAEFVDEADDWYSKYSENDEWVSLPMRVQCYNCGANIQAGEDDTKEDVINQWNTREILDRAVDVSDDKTFTTKEKAMMFYKFIKRYNKY